MTGDILDEVASRLRKRRLEANLTQEEIALRSGLSRSGYRKLERTGNSSLGSFISVLSVLGREREMLRLLDERKDYATLDDFLGKSEPERVRARRRRQ